MGNFIFMVINIVYTHGKKAILKVKKIVKLEFYY